MLDEAVGHIAQDSLAAAQRLLVDASFSCSVIA